MGHGPFDCKFYGLIHCWLQTGQLQCVSSCLSRIVTSWVCPELPCTGSDKIWPAECFQNCLVQVVTGACCQGRLKPVLKELHRLPLWARISFKTATFVHKVRTNHQPSYLADHINNYRPARTLYSSSINLLKHPPMKSSSIRLLRGRLIATAFLYTAAKTWNNLPVTVWSFETLGSFWRQLKKHWF